MDIDKENQEKDENNLNNSENGSIINKEIDMASLENLKNEIGENKKVKYKVDEYINAYTNTPNNKTKTKILRIEKDLLENDVYFTELNFKKHIIDNFGEQRLSEIQDRIIETIKNPDFVLREIEKGTIVYGKYYGKRLFASSVIGEESRRYFTMYERDRMFEKINDRYKILYDIKGIEK